MTLPRPCYAPPALEICAIDAAPSVRLPLFESTVPAGFPSPAEDYEEMRIDLNQHLVRHPAATFYARVHGHSMQEAHIHDGDLLVIDRALTARENHVVVCILDGAFTVKRLGSQHGQMCLLPAHPDYAPIPVSQYQDFCVWGVVTYVIHHC